jgi:hypothetical protein
MRYDGMDERSAASAARVAAGTVKNEDGGALLRLAASCPRCGARPAMRITEPLMKALGAEPATRRLATYQCQRRGCGAVYDLAGDAFRKAH